MKKNVKNSIVEAAIPLFNNKGFNGTTIRDIAKKANVNIANIAYYFNNKQGLLEYCLTDYFEQYIYQIEQNYLATKKMPAGDILRAIAKGILEFQSKYNELTRFVLREVSIDSQIIREIMATYYKKEWYYLKNIFEKGLANKNKKTHSINYLIIQFKSLLTMPYLNEQYVNEVLHIYPNEAYFAKRYFSEIENWINNIFTAELETVLL